MEDDKPLFRWSRITEPRSYSRKKNITKTEDIEKWLDRIDTAATRAVVKAAKKDSHPSHPSGSSASSDVYGEARQLLNSWLTKKETAHLSEGDGLGIAPEGPDRLAIKREWDRLLGVRSDPTDGAEADGEEEEEEEERDGSLSAYTLGPLAQLAAGEGLATVAAARQREEWEASESVETIMKRMLAKDYVDKRKLRRMEETTPTPRSDLKTKLELRQERAREARERRRRMEEERKREKALKKEAEAEARKMLLEEERAKAAEAKREEEMIQKEMVRIRKEMQEARKREEEAAALEEARLRREHEAESRPNSRPSTTRTAHDDAERDLPNDCEGEMERKSLVAMQRRKEEILAAVQRGERRQASRDLKLLQRCFASWFSLVLDRRLQLGRAAAIADWRLLRVSFHAWRDLVRRQRLEAAAAAAACAAIREQRNLRAAEAFARSLLLRRCFVAWRHFVAQARQQRAEEVLTAEKRRKMTAFLQAAAAAAEKEKEEEKEKAKEEEVEEEEETPQSVSPRCHTPSLCSPPRADRPVSKRRSAVTREAPPPSSHGRNSSTGSATDRSDAAPQPYRAPKMVSAFEHRYRNQQEALKEQARRLDEQARLIEELRYEQRQAELKREVQEIRAEREKAKTRPVKILPPPEAAPEAEEPADGQIEAERADSSARTDNSRTTEARPAGKKDPVLKRMEQRAAERAKAKAEREERRKLQEKKKAEEAAAHLLEQQRQEEEQKAARARDLRERRRAEKAAEQERLAAAARTRELQDRADAFRQRAQLRYRGLLPWKKLLAIRSEQEALAVQHWNTQLMGCCFSAWLSVIEEKNRQEEELVRQFRNRAILRKAFNHWRLSKFYTEAMEMKAQNFYEVCLMRRTLHAWLGEVRDQQAHRWDLEILAKNFHNERLLRRAFSAWRQFPTLQREEKAREQRLDAIRRRVQTLLPDFQPPSTSDSVFDEL